MDLRAPAQNGHQENAAETLPACLPAMSHQPTAASRPPSRLIAFGRFAVRAVRVSASTVAVVALLRQQWLTGACFTMAWVLILAAPRVFPSLMEVAAPPLDGPAD